MSACSWSGSSLAPLLGGASSRYRSPSTRACARKISQLYCIVSIAGADRTDQARRPTIQRPRCDVEGALGLGYARDEERSLRGHVTFDVESRGTFFRSLAKGATSGPHGSTPSRFTMVALDQGDAHSVAGSRSVAAVRMHASPRSPEAGAGCVSSEARAAFRPSRSSRRCRRTARRRSGRSSPGSPATAARSRRTSGREAAPRCPSGTR